MTFPVQKILLLILSIVLYIGKPTISSPDYRIANPFLSINKTQKTRYTQNPSNNRGNFSAQRYYLNFTIYQAKEGNKSSQLSYKLERKNRTTVPQDHRNSKNSSIDHSRNQRYSFTITVGNRSGTEFHKNLNNDVSAKRKSEIKCREYEEAVSKKVWALPLVGANPEGISIAVKGGKCQRLHTPLIVGGTRAESGEFPHMAALGWVTNDNFEHFCGGSLISDRWILTAAHCTHSSVGRPSVVRLGAHVLSNNATGRLADIKKIYRHPRYKPPALYADIALLELKNPVTFTDEIRPACLYLDYEASPAQTWATGWGVVETGGDRSDALLKTRLDILDNLTCNRKYNRSISVPRGIVPSMICAGDLTNNWKSDTCQADSGGPLQVINSTINCLYQLVGITSFGILCALQDFPGIYTRVSHYLDWIEGIVWPEAA